MGNLRIPSGGLKVDGVEFPAGTITMNDPYWAKALEDAGATPTKDEAGTPVEPTIIATVPQILDAAALAELEDAELRALALEHGVHVDGTPDKDELIRAILAGGTSDGGENPAQSEARAADEAGQIVRTDAFQAAAISGGTGPLTSADVTKPAVAAEAQAAKTASSSKPAASKPASTAKASSPAKGK